MEYCNKLQLIKAIESKATLFIEEFISIPNDKKDLLLSGVDKTPAQMIAYQLGWMKLVKSWDDIECAGGTPILPAPEYKWNNLGGLYHSFYQSYQGDSLDRLIDLFHQELKTWLDGVESLSDDTLFRKDARNWTKPFKQNWTVARFIHINSVAPFQSFRTKVRKWKKLCNSY